MPNSNSIGIQVCGKRILPLESRSGINSGISCRDSKRLKSTMRSGVEFTLKNHQQEKVKEIEMACTRLSNCKARGLQDTRIKSLSSLRIRTGFS